VHAATDRLKEANLVDSVEDEQTCCYATQNKVWTLDPQGLRWEFYRVIEDSDRFGGSGGAKAADDPTTETQAGCCGRA
jgi:hypothetical protein